MTQDASGEHPEANANTNGLGWHSTIMGGIKANSDWPRAQYELVLLQVRQEAVREAKGKLPAIPRTFTRFGLKPPHTQNHI